MELQGQRIHRRLGFGGNEPACSRGQFSCGKVKRHGLEVVMATVRNSFSLGSRIMSMLWKVSACSCRACPEKVGKSLCLQSHTFRCLDCRWSWDQELSCHGGSWTTVPEHRSHLPAALGLFVFIQNEWLPVAVSWSLSLLHSTCPRKEPKCNNFPAAWVPRYHSTLNNLDPLSLNNLDFSFKKRNQVMSAKLGIEL